MPTTSSRKKGFFKTSLNLSQNLSGSQFEIQNADTFRVRNVTAPDYPGAYLIDFKWDPVNLVFVPVNVGAETLYKISGYVKTTGGEVISGAAININTQTQTKTATIAKELIQKQR